MCEFLRMREITWSVKGALTVLLQSFSLTSIYRIVLQKLSIKSHLRPFSATFVLRMRRNGYLWTSGVNLDTAVRFADPDFLLECKISAIWRRFPLIFAFYMLNVRHIFSLVCLTYWPTKYTTGVDPHVDNSHQVWSSYDHPCRVIAFLFAGTLCDLWPFDLEELTYMAGHVTNLVTKFEDPMPIRS